MPTISQFDFFTKPIYREKIIDLEMSKRSYNALANTPLVYIGELVLQPANFKTHNFARKSLDEVKFILESLGQSLGTVVDGLTMNPLELQAELGQSVENSTLAQKLFDEVPQATTPRAVPISAEFDLAKPELTLVLLALPGGVERPAQSRFSRELTRIAREAGVELVAGATIPDKVASKLANALRLARVAEDLNR